MVAESIPCYITNKNTGSVVSFEVEIPETVNDSYITNFESQSTKGRSSPFKAYQSSGPRSVSFSVTMAYDLRRDIKETVNELRDMLKPTDAGYILAPRVHVRIGDILNIEAVPMSFNVIWREGYKNSTYRVCDCEFAFDEVEDVGTFATGGFYQQITTNTRRASDILNHASKDFNGNSLQTDSSGGLTIGSTLRVSGNMEGYGNKDSAQYQGGYTYDIPAGEYTILNKYKDTVQLQVGDEKYWIRSVG